MSENNDDWQMQRAMSPRQYERAITALGLNQASAGRFLGVSERTSRRYVSGDAEIPASSVMLLRLMMHKDLTPVVPKWRPTQY